MAKVLDFRKQSSPLLHPRRGRKGLFLLQFPPEYRPISILCRHKIHAFLQGGDVQLAAVGDFLAEEGAAEEVVDRDIEGGSGVGGLEGDGVVGWVGVEGDLGSGGSAGWGLGVGEFEYPEVSFASV